MDKPSVFPLFSAPVYVRNTGAFDLPDIKQLTFSSESPGGGSLGFLTSVDKHVLDRPEFRPIHDMLLGEINAYAKGILRVHDRIEFYITNSWININRPGDQCAQHTHNNSLISGVLYLKSPANGGDLIFYRDINALVPFPPALDLEIGAQNIYNCKHFAHTPKVNDVCLFPSVLMHSVGPNESTEERWCLPFNVFVRGDIGGMHELHLK